jgi:enoyl-[acyl-carrier protein] reductase I
MSGAVTGEVHFVDCGYNTVSMPTLEQLKAAEQEHSAAIKGRTPGEAAE